MKGNEKLAQKCCVPFCLRSVGHLENVARESRFERYWYQSKMFNCESGHTWMSPKVAVFVAMFCVCCCRCAGKCGGYPEHFDKRADSCKRPFFGVILSVFVIAAMFGVVSAFVTNQYSREGVQKLPQVSVIPAGKLESINVSLKTQLSSGIFTSHEAAWSCRTIGRLFLSCFEI